jgi:lysophospholipase L1-like esterase
MIVATWMLVVVSFAEASESMPYLIVAMGDSLSAASLANVEGPKRDYDPALDGPADDAGEESGGIGGQPDPAPLLDALGIDYLKTNKKTLSWPTGQRIRSHRRLLEAWLKEQGNTRKLNAYNVSRPGKRADDLESQAAEIVKASKAGLFHSILYATLMIGNNDACSRSTPEGTPNDKMKASLRAGFRKLSEVVQDTPIRVLVSSLPRIAELGEGRIRLAKTLWGMRCQRIRNGIMSLCEPMVTWKSDSEYREKLAVLDRKNQAIFEAAMEARNEFPNLDIHYSDRLRHERLSADQLAVDCFHPGKMGQEKVSLLLWDDQPWFKLGSVPRP